MKVWAGLLALALAVVFGLAGSLFTAACIAVVGLVVTQPPHSFHASRFESSGWFSSGGSDGTSSVVDVIGNLIDD